jgi:hypothetical protein
MWDSPTLDKELGNKIKIVIIDVKKDIQYLIISLDLTAFFFGYPSVASILFSKFSIKFPKERPMPFTSGLAAFEPHMFNNWLCICCVF